MAGLKRATHKPALVDGRLQPRHFLDIDQLDTAELRGIIEVGAA